jgi:hypothetical protein
MTHCCTIIFFSDAGKKATMSFFFLNIEKKATTTCCYGPGYKQEENYKTRHDMTILKNWEFYWSINWCWSAWRLFPSSLQHCHKRRRQHIAIVFFFSTTPPQNKTMENCYRFLLLKDKEDKTHQKTTKKTKIREGTYLRAPRPSHFWLPFCPFTFGSRYALSL